MDAQRTDRQVSADLVQSLRAAGLKATQPRLSVLHLLQELGGHRSADDLVDELQARGTPLSRASVYNALAALLQRVDTLPVSLVLAQAAIESGWGTSRFAREGNNLFGQWCFDPGCGLVPAARRTGARHEVAAYASVNDSIDAYLLNINTHSAYRDLRELRARARAEGREPTGLELATGLRSYSERGELYVQDVRSIIRGNGLDPGG
jgi:uncharacterized FlgJ-related protein